MGTVAMRRVAVVVLLVLVGILHATPAWAQGSGADEFVVLSGPADVPEGNQVGDLVVFHGSSTVDGTVDGSLTAFDAPVTISGRVNGDVVVFNGPVVLRSGANVSGDIVSQDDPQVESGATVGGETRRVQTNVSWEGFGWAGRLAWWVAISVSTLVVGVANWARRFANPGGRAHRHTCVDCLGTGRFLRPADPGRLCSGQSGWDTARPGCTGWVGADLRVGLWRDRMGAWPVDRT
jgi:cytoskeletal protein CcmA (bactofilin family)